MLTSSLLLALKDSLFIASLLAYILAYYYCQARLEVAFKMPKLVYLVSSIAIGLASSWVLYKLPYTQNLDVTYLALLHIAFYGIACCLLIILVTSNSASFSLYILCYTTTVLEANSLVVFVASYAINQPSNGLIFGLVLGVGIATSFAYLQYFILSIIKQPLIPIIGAIVIMSAQLARSTNLLAQADIVNSGKTLWNTSSWIPEENIFGQIISILVGYESRPTALYLSIFCLSIVCLTSGYFLLRKYPNETKRG